MNRKRLLMIAAVAAAAWGAWALFAGGEDAAPVAGAGAPKASGKAAKDRVTADKVPVVVSSLSRPASAEDFVRERNLFEFAQSPDELATIEEERQRAAAAARAAAEAAAKDAADRIKLQQEQAERDRKLKEEQDKLRRQELALNPPKPTPPSFPYQYVGTIGPVDAPFAILTGPDRAYRYVKAGEVIDSQFKLEFIAENRLDLSYTDQRFSDQFTQVQRQSESAKSLR